MEQASSSTPASTGRSTDPATARQDRNIALVCSVLLLIGMPIGWLPGSTGDTIGLIGLGLLSLALTAGAVLWLAPRERVAGRAERTALILGVLAAITVLVFWTGIPFPLGAGAMALGLSAREAAGTGHGRATAAVVLGALAVGLSAVALLVG